MSRIIGHPPMYELPMSVQTKPSIVFAHGIWADGSCFNKVIPALQAEGHQVLAAQYGLDTQEGDVAAVAPDAGETVQGQLNQFPPTGVFSHIEIADGRVWMLPEGVKYFAGDLSEEEQKVVWA